MTELGHVVYYVRDLDASVRFYHQALGLQVSGKIFNGRAALLTGGRTHHELLLIEVVRLRDHYRVNELGSTMLAGKSVIR